ncbi:hypothetical protein BTHI11S_00185 [Bosea thiooxidans]
MTLHGQLKAMCRSSDDIASIRIRTHEACIRIIDKRGPLHNPADRDHTIQYMVAVPLIFGRLPPPTTRTTSPPIRASMRCARRSNASRIPPSPATTMTPTSARSPTA